jgi:hypothetical protein
MYSYGEIMKIEKIHKTWISWHGLHKAGGLFFGLRIQFPISVWDGFEESEHIPTNTTYISILVSFGFGIGTLTFCLNWNRKPI